MTHRPPANSSTYLSMGRLPVDDVISVWRPISASRTLHCRGAQPRRPVIRLWLHRILLEDLTEEVGAVECGGAAALFQRSLYV